MRLLRPRARSLEGRIVGFFVVLLMTVQLAAFFSIRYAIERNARNILREELDVGARVFSRLLEQNSQQLAEVAAVLTYDYGFREAVAVQDRDTILSVLRNHSARIKASGMALVDLDKTLVADTTRPELKGTPFGFPELIGSSGEQRRTSSIRIVDGTIYQIVVVPVLAPLPVAWVAMYFVIDNTTANDLRRITNLDVSFVGIRTGPGGSGNDLLATTLGAALAPELKRQIDPLMAMPERRGTRTLGGKEYEMLAILVERYGDRQIVALLQRSLNEGLRPYHGLQVALLALALAGLAVTLLGSMRIAHRISRPVRELADAARRIEDGSHQEVLVRRTDSDDEIGALTNAFNAMSRGLAERDRMRDVLGKVASPEVAARLIAEKIELGGEERRVTVLFADIRNFTSIAERLTPHRSLELLNRYLAILNAVIEKHGGVIDKYTGDGVMALFGAPISREDDAARAVATSLEMVRAVRDLGGSLAADGLPHPDIGIGLNTSEVIAGNVGTPSRFNYTVLGDGVNLAARLETLTKRYRVPIVCGQPTRALADEFTYRELDKVRVRGKSIPVTIFEPLGRAADLGAEQREWLGRHHEAIARFRRRDWEAAERDFAALSKHPDYAHLAALYLGYLRDFAIQPPDASWDGSFTLFDK
jgi:adenylate cyclase